MDGISKVINELGLMIVAKEIEIKQQAEEIETLKRKIEMVEQYLDAYDSYLNSDNISDK